MSETELETLVVRLVGDVDGLVKAFDQATKASEQMAKGIQEQTGKIDGFIGKVEQTAQAAAAAFAAIGFEAWKAEAVASFAEAEMVVVKLTSALRANDREVEVLLKDYQDFAMAMQNATTMGDEAVLMLLRQAETFDLTGDAAKRAVKDAIGLAEANDSSASAMIRMTAAMAKGDAERAMQFARMVPQLRGVKDEAEFLQKYAKLVETGFGTATAMTLTHAGSLRKLREAYGNLMEDFGKVVADGLKPLIRWGMELVAWLQAMPMWAKETIVQVGKIAAIVVTLGVAVPALLFVLKSLGTFMAGPLVMALGYLLNPLKSIGLLISGLVVLVKGIAGPFIAVFGVILQPLSLFVIACGAVLAALLHFTGAGSAALKWFGEQWDNLMTHVGPAIEGIKQALASGDTVLAFKIAWAQIKLSFMEGTQGLQEIWYGFVGVIKVWWADAVKFVSDTWAKAVAFVKQFASQLEYDIKVTTLATKYGWDEKKMASPEAQAEFRALNEAHDKAKRGISADLQKDLDANRAAHDKALMSAKADWEKSLQGVKDTIMGLETERGKLLDEAFSKMWEQAEFDPTAEIRKAGGPPAPITKHKEEKGEATADTKRDAVRFGSAEAILRVQAQRDAFNNPMLQIADKQLKVQEESRDQLVALNSKEPIMVGEAGVA